MFVVILHIDNYTYQLKGESFSNITEIVYNVLETIAYPAIHLFVLAGSFLMQGKKKIKGSQYIYIYSLMYFTTIIGLLLMIFIDRKVITITSLVQSVLPFSARAYGYVSSYLLLMLLVPIFNILISHLDKKKLLIFCAILSLGIVVFPTLLFGIWDNDYMSLFIFLYFVAAYAKKEETFFNKKSGLVIWIISIVLLNCSTFAIKFLGNYITYFHGKENYFFHYNSILVVGAAIGLFMMLTKVNINNGILKSMITTISSTSLFIYLYHMHPVIKGLYNQWELLRFIDVNNGAVYLLEVVSLACLIVAVGSFLGKKLLFTLSY